MIISHLHRLFFAVLIGNNSVLKGAFSMRCSFAAMLWVLSALSCSAIAAGQFDAKTSTSAKQPNLIMLYADDMGYGDASCFGNKNYKTPNLDKMAEQGVKLTQFYVASPACTPSRAALMTGKYPLSVGLPQVLNASSLTGIRPETKTIADLVKPAGYNTMCIGKWNLGHLPQFLPTRHGFDHYYGIPYSNDMKPTPLMEDNTIIEEPVNQDTLARRYTERALKFIDSSKSSGKPFFLYLPYSSPHVPLHVSDKFKGSSGFDLYGDVITEIDWSVGEILKHLTEAGLDKNTLVIFSSDNGPWLIKKENGGSAGPLRDGKGTPYEGGIREPFIAWWPGTLPAGRVSNLPAINMDILPTFCKLAGADVPPTKKWHGQDMMPLLKDGKGEENRTFYFDDYYTKNPVGAVRDGKWKLVLGRKAKGKLAARKTELFDMDTDIGEAHDLSAEHPDIVKKLKNLADVARARFKAENPWGADVRKKSPEAIKYVTKGTTESLVASHMK